MREKRGPMKLVLLIAAALITLAPAAFAGEYDGNELLRNCNAAVRQADGEKVDGVEALGGVYCTGYLAGFAASHAVEAMAKPQRRLYCLPEKGLEGSQLARIVTKHLKKNPEELHTSARMHVVTALTVAFPCKK